MGFVRLVIFGFIFMTGAYLLISVYSRSVRREKLEKHWAEVHPNGGDPMARETFIELGMKDYQSSLRRKLILLVYVLPVILIATIHFITTYT
ncbi:hypothetical protein [Albibacillus kandeliae]|uniref:hypothetical protein n=1 Tax=Albibacillus kandeliae TaxID=2174228 RepID=UPI000D68EC3C|nr:hypothetical protein [Albibacillus kandeliae]